MEIVSLVASVVSVVIGVIAVWLSLYFYTQTKRVETNVQLALEAIKTQTNALQSLSTRYLDRLTKYVTTPREDVSHTAEILVATIRDIPSMVANLRMPNDTAGQAQLRREIISCYIVVWYYSALTNIWVSGYLPLPQDFNSADTSHLRVKYLVDQSHNDFLYITDLIAKVDYSEIQSNAVFSIYEETQTRLRHLVADTAEHFAHDAQSQS